MSPFKHARSAMGARKMSASAAPRFAAPGKKIGDAYARLHQPTMPRLTIKNSEATAEAQHQVQRGLLLDVIVRQRPPILELLAREDKALLVGRDPLLVLDLRLDVVDGVRRLDVQRDGLARQRLDEDLHGCSGLPLAVPSQAR